MLTYLRIDYFEPMYAILICSSIGPVNSADVNECAVNGYKRVPYTGARGAGTPVAVITFLW